MPHASETWPIAAVDSARLVTDDNAMVRWMCKNVCHAQNSRYQGLENSLRTGRLRWYGHIERQPNDVWPNAVRQMNVVGRGPRSHPRKRWSDCVLTEMRELRLEKEDVQDRVK